VSPHVEVTWLGARYNEHVGTLYVSSSKSWSAREGCGIPKTNLYRVSRRVLSCGACVTCWQVSQSSPTPHQNYLPLLCHGLARMLYHLSAACHLSIAEGDRRR